MTLPQAPQRIVSLNQGSTEILLSLGVADRMVGTATWTDPVLPALADANAEVERLAENNPSLEVVLQKEPDLVTASFHNTLAEGGVADRATFGKLGVPTYMSPSECVKANNDDGDGARSTPLEMSTISQEVTELGRLLSVPGEAERVNASLNTRLDAAAATPAKDGTSVVYWFANSEQPYVAGGYGAPGIISRTLKLTNVYSESTQEWPQVGWEDFAAKNPDVIVLGDLTRKSQTAETAAAKIAFLEKNPVTRQMDAVRNKRYITVSGGDLNPSLRTVDGVEKVAAGLKKLGLGG
ncbi:ABC transporter substrate-binding protein [Mobilicoccus caccae]|uniref:ABC transporter substrate-binding protein n=1 Tax=Mobilicoccus caccae TaxID=1859295 RepID=UPI0024E05503|nr:ABC transporter substrate-binding protein [Mobilicoccus caccae]